MLFAGLSNLTKRSKSGNVNVRPRVYYLSRWKKLIFLTIVCVIFILCLWLLGKNHSNSRGTYSSIYHTFPEKFNVSKAEGLIYVDYTKATEGNLISNFRITQETMCPACFSQVKCNNSVLNEIQIYDGFAIEHSNRSELWLNGIYKKTKKIQVGYVEQSHWVSLETAICKTSNKPCKIENNIKKSSLSNQNTMDVSNLINLHRILGKPISEMPLLICATEKMAHQLKQSFDEDGDSVLNNEEKLILLTSLIMHPSYAMMKFKKNGKLNIPIPNLLGACGRVILRESEWTSLTDQINEPFGVRAGIALQILQAVEDLQEEDPEWYFLNTDFSYESLMRNTEGEIILVNLQDVAIVDKSTFPKRQTLPMLDPEGEICNDLCFHKFSQEILKNQNNTNPICSQISKYGQLMQALVCKQILSDLEEHKTEGYYNFAQSKKPKKSNHKGFLHSVPDQDRDAVEDLLRECVQETNVGGRKQAVEELREILEKYLNYEDQEDKTNREDEN